MSHSLPNKFRGLVSASCLTLVFITLAGAADSDRPNPAALAIVRHGLPAVRPVCLRATGPSSADRGVEQVAVELLERHIEQRAGVRLPQLVVESRDLAARLRETSAKLIVLGTAERLKNQACLPQRVKELAGKLGPEGYCISSSARCRSGYPAVVVIGADERGLLYGVGRLLRSMTFLGRDVDLADIEVCTTPALKVRGHLLANHIWSPQYDNWDEAQWDRYLADLALWGVNTILTTPYHPGEWAACRPFDDPPVFTDERVRQTWQFYLARAAGDSPHRAEVRHALWPVDSAQ